MVITRRLMLAGLGATLAAPAAAEPFAGRYKLYVGGLSVAEGRIAVRRDGARYAADAAFRAAGVFDWLFDAKATAQAEGALGADGPRPEGFEADAAFGDDLYTLSMRFDPYPRVEAEPPLRVRDYDAEPQALAGALDPLSAAVAVCLPTPAAEVGSRTIAFYDARRRIDVVIGAAERSRGGRLKARAELRRVAGFKAKHLAEPHIPLTAWWDVEKGVATLSRLDGATPFGAAVVTRRG